MTRTGDDRAPYESGETGQKSHRRPFRPEINEETQNVSQDACQNISSGGGNSASTFAAIGISELQQMLKHKIFSRPTGGSPDDFHEKASTISTSQPPTQDSKLIINKNATSMENLPCELLSNIFIRLLAKQLAQMRCVSKSWNALLSQSSFVKSHLHRSITNNDQTFLVFYYKQQ